VDIQLYKLQQLNEIVRILIIFPANMDLGSGSAVRARLIAEGLNHLGAEIGVVTSGSAKFSAESGIKCWAHDGSKSWKDMIDAAIELFRPDVLYGITEALADIVIQAARRGTCKVVFDLHGLGVIEIMEMGSGHGPRGKRIRNSLRWLSLLRKADAITYLSPTIASVARLLNKHAVPIIGMTDISQFSSAGPSVPLGHDPAKIQVLYSGNFYKWQGIDLLFDAMEILLAIDNQFEFTILGSIGRNDSIQKRTVAAFPVGSVRFLDSVDYGEVAAYYRGADVLVIPRPFMLSTYFAFPQKLGDYMAAGKTIVATDIAPHRWALKQPPCGILCPPTPKGIADGLRTAENKRLRQELAANARKKATEQFCHIKQSEKIYALFQQMLEDR
jgi:glycosyltransferase involved in cell wall biosynthesis